MRNQEKYIVGIGAANVDIHGRSINALNMRDSNPGRMHVSCGGVTRNILENYARLGGRACLLTVVGNDIYGQKILSESALAGIDVSHVMSYDNHSSSTYMSILDSDGDMAVALSDMSIMEDFSVDYLKENDELLINSPLIVCDPSIPLEVMDHVLDNYGKEIPVFVDPVSISYAGCIKNKIGKFFAAKPNVLECELLSSMKISDRESLVQAAKKVIDQGLDEIYVSLGKDGCMYMNSEGKTLWSSLKPLEEVVNATGAGDAFMAMIIYGYMHEFDRQKTLDYASAAGIAAIMSPDTINKNISIGLIEKILEEKRK